jgi:hypothetical protein
VLTVPAAGEPARRNGQPCAAGPGGNRVAAFSPEVSAIAVTPLVFQARCPALTALAGAVNVIGHTYRNGRRQ